MNGEILLSAAQKMRCVICNVFQLCLTL